MKKRDLMKALEGLDDDAVIYIETDEAIYLFDGFKDKVIGDKVENEITLIAD